MFLLASSQHDIQQTIRALDTTYSQLLGLTRALELERQYLEVRNNVALANLALARLSHGKTSLGSISSAIGSKQEAIDRRKEILTNVDPGPIVSRKPGEAALLPDEEAAFDRIKRGQFKWPKGGNQ